MAVYPKLQINVVLQIRTAQDLDYANLSVLMKDINS